jgi:hypothetical protein
MGRVKHRSILGQQIANILGTAGNSAKNRAMLRTAATRSLVCGGVALLVVAPAQVEAVGLGEIRVQSTLGRPLQAFVPMRVGTGETLPANCVKPGTSRGELTQPQDLRVASPTVTEPGTYNLRISTPKSLHEPMYELSLVINCPGTPVLVRHYVLMLDLPGTLASIPAMEAAKPPNNLSRPPQVPGTAAQNIQPVSPDIGSSDAPKYDSRRAAQPDASRALEKSAAPIQDGTLYRVRQGDTLSTIAARIDGRLPDTTWAVAEQLFVSNPDAFIRNNPDLIKLGSLIQIPETAELASIAPVSSAGLRQQAAPAEPTPVPFPSVERPAAAALRAEAARTDTSPAINQQAELVLEADLVPVAIRAENYQALTIAEPVSDALPNSGAEPVKAATPDPKERDDMGAGSPFADEVAADPATIADTQQTAAPLPVAGVAAPADGKFSPWLAIGVGIFLGLAAGLLILRRRFLTIILDVVPSRDAINALVARLTRSTKSKEANRFPAADGDMKTGAFDTKAAHAAFDTTTSAAGDTPTLQIGDPLEKTYIVETLEPEATRDGSEGPLETTEVWPHEMPSAAIDDQTTLVVDNSAAEKTEVWLDKEPDAASLTGPSSPAGKSDDEMLAEIFAETPAGEFGDGGTGMLEPTAQLSKSPEEEVFDPSSELPQQLATGDVIDPTAEMPLDPTADVGGTLMQAFTEGLEEIDPEIFDGSAQIDGADDTRASVKITSDEDEETRFDDLPIAAEEDDEMSKTLYDALTLLERDYEDEFTASQILERSAIKKSLETMDGETEDEDMTKTLERKLLG